MTESPGSPLVSIGLAFGFLLIAGIVFGTGLPPVCDYPNHLARYWLMSGGASIPPVSSMYSVDWRRASSIGVDLFAALTGRALPYTLVGKFILTIAFIGPPAGAAFLSRIVFARWHWWQLSFAVLAWTTTALYGFINYQVSLAAALLFACLDGLLPVGKALKTVIRIVFATAVAWLHPFGLIFYVSLLTALVIGESWRAIVDSGRRRSIVQEGFSPALALVVPLVLLVALAPALPADHSGQGIIFGSFKPYYMLLTVASPFVSYKLPIDLLFVGPLLAIYAYSIAARRARTHAGLIIVGAALAIASPFMPFALGDASEIDRRLPLMAALLLFAGVLPEPFPAKLRTLAAVGLIALASARSLWVAHVWQSRQQDVQAVEAAIGQVPAGATLFSVQSKPRDIKSAPTGRYLAGIPGYWSGTMMRHVTALVVPQRHAFIASLFAVPGQHPLKVLPPFDTMSANTAVPDVHVLDGPPTPEASSKDPYLRDWDKRFDYVIAIGMDIEDMDGPFNPPSQLQQVSDDGYARLYRVARQDGVNRETQ